MSSLIEHIEIKNFKSIRHLKMDGFRRINLFIGKPNVGKSNILEALSVFTIPYLKDNPSSKLTDLIRLENLDEIFYEGNFKSSTNIKLVYNGGEFKSRIQFESNTVGRLTFLSQRFTQNPIVPNNGSEISFDSNFILNGYFVENYEISNIKRFIFKTSSLKINHSVPFLYPPFGINLMHVLELHEELREAIKNWIKPNNLRLVLDKASNSLKIMKDNGNDVFIMPYSSIADTLQRIIFYKTAIASNKDSVLIFEEPEAHAYPPYIAEFTQEVINSETNQFFMATHSPIIVNDFLENAIDDLAIFMVDFKDGQTVVKGLSRDEIHDVYKYGVDLFFNNEAYPVQ